MDLHVGDRVSVCRPDYDIRPRWFVVLHECPSGVIVGQLTCGLVLRGDCRLLREEDFDIVREVRSGHSEGEQRAKAESK